MDLKKQKPSKNIIDKRAPLAKSGEGKGDRRNSPDSPMGRVGSAAKKQKNFFSAERLKKS